MSESKMLSLTKGDLHPLLLSNQGLACKAYSDVTIKGGRGHEIPTHRLMLAAVSSMLTLALLDVEHHDENLCVIVPDAPERSIRDFLEFIRCEQVILDEVAYNNLLVLLRLLGVFYTDESQTDTDSFITVPEVSDIVTQRSVGSKPQGTAIRRCRKGDNHAKKLVTDMGSRSQKGVKTVLPAAPDTVAYGDLNLDPNSNASETQECKNKDNAPTASQNIYSENDSDEMSDDAFGFKCGLCGKCFSEVKYLLKHTMEKHVAKPFQCKHCEISMTTKATLNRHVATVHDKKSSRMKYFQCSHCEVRTTQNGSLDRHVAIVHYNQSSNDSCHLCSKTFTRADNFRQHLKAVHFNESMRMHVCGICRKRFTLKRHLTYHHEKTHTGEKLALGNATLDETKHESGISEDSSANGRHLTDHEKTHTGEKLVLGNAASGVHHDEVKHASGISKNNSTNSTEHEKAHTGEKLLLCNGPSGEVLLRIL